MGYEGARCLAKSGYGEWDSLVGKAEYSVATAIRMMPCFYNDCLKNLREFLPSNCACLATHVYINLSLEEIKFNSAEYLVAKF